MILSHLNANPNPNPHPHPTTRAWSPHTQPEAVVCDSVTPAPVAAAPDVRDKVTDENANVNPYPNANPNPEVIDESLNLTV